MRTANPLASICFKNLAVTVGSHHGANPPPKPILFRLGFYLGIPVPNTYRYQYREPLSLNFLVGNVIHKKADKIPDNIMIRIYKSIAL